MMHSICTAILLWEMTDGKIDSTSMPKSLKLNIYIWQIEFRVGFAPLEAQKVIGRGGFGVKRLALA